MASTDLGQLSARVSLDTVDFSRNMAQLKRELKTSKTDFDLAGKGIHRYGRNVTNTGAQMKELQRQIALNGQRLKGNIADYTKAANNAAKAGLVTSKAMQTAQQKAAATQLELAKVVEQYKQLYIQNDLAGNKLYQFSEKAGTAFGKIAKGGKAVAKFGDQWTKAGVVIGGATGLVIKQFVDWESSVASMNKTIDASPQEIDNLASSFRNMSKEIPVSSRELNELAGVAGQLGIETNAIEGFTRTVADLGATTNVSSEEAAISLAQFANITRMSQGDFDRLGSTIVALGNNFATQEDAIIAMSQRLAAAGHQIGLTEPQIVGISTALSSLGIQAEQGGSSFSKLMINMQLATSRGGKDLEDFANVAGMSSSQFKKAFEEDAVSAIAAFVNGLGHASDHGETAIGILDEMGIKEIRLRDTLLRAGNAQDLFTNAVEMGTDAWNENTALTNEANIRYETTASKIQIAKNEIQDMAIELGGALIPAIADLMKSGAPVVEMLSNWITRFAESSDSTKKFVTAMLGISIVGGPVLSVIGRLGQAVGITGKAVFGGISMFEKFKTGLKATEATSKMLTTAMSDMGVEVAAGGSVMTTLSTSTSSVLASMVPLVPAIAGVTAAVVVGYGAWKIWGEKALEASQRTQKWGSDIGEEADKALTSFQDLGSEASLATLTMVNDVQDGAQNAIEAYDQMSKEIIEGASSTIKETQEQLASLPESVREIVKDSYDAHVEEQQGIIDETKSINDKINAIYRNAMEENRELSSEELEIVKDYHNQLSELRSKSLELDAEEQKKVHAVMAEDLKSFSDQQLKERQKLIREESLAVRKGYEEQQADLEEQLTSGVLSRENYNKAVEALQQDEHNKMIEYGAEYYKVMKERNIPLKDIINNLEDLGLTQEEVMRYINMSSQDASKAYDQVAESSANATKETKEANESWNSLAFDEKTGEVKTNLRDVIQEASESDEGWEKLQFILKHANLDTNSKETIMEALMANGKWWDMDFPPQFADLETNAGTTAADFLNANGLWEQLEYDQKMAILNSNSSETLQKALQDAGVWDNLDPEDKELLMSTNAGLAAKEALIANGVWNNLSPQEKQMVVRSNSTEEAIKGVQANGKWNGLKFHDKFAELNTNSPNKAAQGVQANRSWNNLRFGKKNANLNTNAPHTEAAIKSADNTMAGIPNRKRTFTIDRITNFITKHIGGGAGAGVGKKAAGSNHFEGGNVILGDGGQHEPFMTPDGNFGISPKQDTLYDLPRGTKVWRNVESLLSDLPHYAKGTMNAPMQVGDKVFNQLTDALMPFSNRLSANKSEMTSESSSQTQQIAQISKNQSDVNTLLQQLLSSNGKPVNLYLNGSKVGTAIVPILDKLNGQRISDTEGGLLL